MAALVSKLRQRQDAYLVGAEEIVQVLEKDTSSPHIRSMWRWGLSWGQKHGTESITSNG